MRHGAGLHDGVHPRVCGGAPAREYRMESTEGPSPRVRGSLIAFGAAELWTRSIPACAGEPALHGRRRGAHGVHPRVCGGAKR